jgi:uncharacterized membrane protein YphA (DoxX/SURF4 family)
METSIKGKSSFRLTPKLSEVIVSIISLMFAVLFLYAASSKLLDYENSELQLAKSPIVTEFSEILVWLLPLIEIATSLLLIIPSTVKYGLYLSLGLMCLFTAYIFFILNYSEIIPCSCGGILEMLSWSEHFVFNIVFVGLAITAIIIRANRD